MEQRDDQKGGLTSGIGCKTANRALERPAHCSNAIIGEPRTKPALHSYDRV